MKILKNILIVFLLVCLTCAIIFIPPFFSGQKESDNLGKVSYRGYEIPQKNEVTSEQLAGLYYTDDIKPFLNDEETTGETIEIVQAQANELFSEDEEIYNYIKKIFEDSAASVDRDDILFEFFDNQPYALRFSRRFVNNEVGYIQTVSEDNTTTILEIDIAIYSGLFGDLEEAFVFSRRVDSLINEYFETELGLTNREYYYSITPSQTYDDDYLYFTYRAKSE